MSSAAREAIKTSFLRFLEERPLREITVKDIVEDCGVNRNSFYYHFKGIPELLEEIVMERSARLIAEQGPSPTLAGCLEAAAGFALEHRQAVLHINQSAHREMFEQCLLDVCRRAMLNYVEPLFHSLDPEDRDVLVRFFQCELFGQIMEWLNAGTRYDLQEQFRRLCRLGEGMTELFLKNAGKNAGEK